LKALHRQGALASERFLREAEVLAALAHPAIVRYVAHGVTAQGEPYLAMEWSLPPGNPPLQSTQIPNWRQI